MTLAIPTMAEFAKSLLIDLSAMRHSLAPLIGDAPETRRRISAAFDAVIATYLKQKAAAVEALKQWHDFYILVGTAGATLLGLLFVAVSLGAGYLTEKHQLGTRTFMSPVVVHFTCVFFLSAVALFPSHQPKFLAALIGATALIGAIISTYTTIQVVRTDMTNYIQDYLAYGLLPGVAYLVLLAAAVSIYLEKDFGLNVLAGALLLLVIVNIRNTWDLTLTLVRRHHRND